MAKPTLTRDLAEARTAHDGLPCLEHQYACDLAEARAALASKEAELAEVMAMQTHDAPLWKRLEGIASGLLDADGRITAAKIADLERRLAVTVGALERVAVTYKDSGGWERCYLCHRAVKRVHELAHCEGQDSCLGGIARAALAPTGAVKP